MTSYTTIEDANLVDLISECYQMNQKVFEEAWNDQNDIAISKSEWNIIARVYKSRVPVSNITRSIGISRQAIHKLIKNLSTKGLIEVHKMENNKKERCLVLTNFGNECYETYTNLKNQMENKITENMGGEEVKQLKSILQAGWGIGSPTK